MNPMFLSILMIAACNGHAGDDPSVVDTGTPPLTPDEIEDPNACGGPEPLIGWPGEVCGTCETGVLACAGPDTLACEGDAGAAALNGCLGCTTLDTSTLLSPCGDCSEGVISCDGTDALACDEPPLASECLPLPAGAVGWWPADADGSDLVGSNDGTLVGGAAIVPGYVGNAFGLDAGQSVQFGDITDFDFSDSDFAIEAWVRFSDLPPELGGGCSAMYPIFANSEWGYVLRILGDGRLNFNKYTSGDAVSVSSDVPIDVDAWTHVAAVHTPIDLTLYIDGRRAAYHVLKLGDVRYVAGDHPSIGDRDCGTETFDMIGEVDELTIYARELPQSEVRDICHAETWGKCL